jgi:hypothetical protein
MNEKIEAQPGDHLVHVAVLAGNEALQMERELLMLVREPISSSTGIDSGKLRMIEARLELITRLVGVLKLFSA